jgi:hypothetical protein
MHCKNQTKRLNTFCGRNAESLNITDGGTYNCQWALVDFLLFYFGGGGLGTASSIVVRINVQSSGTGQCLHVPSSLSSISIMQTIKGSAARLCTACPSVEN